MFSFHDLSDGIFCPARFRRCYSVNITSISQHPPPGVWQCRVERQMVWWSPPNVLAGLSGVTHMWPTPATTRIKHASVTTLNYNTNQHFSFRQKYKSYEKSFKAEFSTCPALYEEQKRCVYYRNYYYYCPWAKVSNEHNKYFSLNIKSGLHDGVLSCDIYLYLHKWGYWSDDKW